MTAASSQMAATCLPDEGLLAAFEAHFRRYAALSPGLPLVLALWAIATHCFDSFDAFPYLAITSPVKRCGKTRVAESLEMVCARGWRTVGATPAVIFRTIELKRPTLIIDEAEVLSTRDERAFALREVLNAGYRKGQTVSRCDDRNGHEPKEYQTYCPKAFVLIGSLSGPLADRCIEIRMQRRMKEDVERFRFARVVQQSAPLKSAAETWAAQQAQGVATWYELNELLFIEDREEELWLPLFAVCSILSQDRIPELQRICTEMGGAKTDAESGEWGIRLLADIRKIFSLNGKDRLQTQALIDSLVVLEESPWSDWNHSNGPNSRDIARLLRSFGIYSQNVRIEEKVLKGYLRESFTNAWERYLSADH